MWLCIGITRGTLRNTDYGVLIPRGSDLVGLACGLSIRIVESSISDYNVQSRTSKVPCKTKILCFKFLLRNLKNFWPGSAQVGLVGDVPEVRPSGMIFSFAKYEKNGFEK